MEGKRAKKGKKGSQKVSQNPVEAWLEVLGGKEHCQRCLVGWNTVRDVW